MNNYEYAGFEYEVHRDENGQVHMVPLPGQHQAASKEKHRMAARDCYLDDLKAGRVR